MYKKAQVNTTFLIVAAVIIVLLFLFISSRGQKLTPEQISEKEASKKGVGVSEVMVDEQGNPVRGIPLDEFVRSRGFSPLEPALPLALITRLSDSIVFENVAGFIPTVTGSASGSQTKVKVNLKSVMSSPVSTITQFGTLPNAQVVLDDNTATTTIPLTQSWTAASSISWSAWMTPSPGTTVTITYTVAGQNEYPVNVWNDLADVVVAKQFNVQSNPTGSFTVTVTESVS